MPVDLTQQLSVLQRELRGHFDKTDEKQSELQKQVDAIELKLGRPHLGGGTFNDPLEKILGEHDGVQRLLKDGRGKCTLVIKGQEIMPLMEHKTLISSTAVGSGTAGVLMPGRVGGIVPLAERRLFIRDVLLSSPTNASLVYFVQEASSGDVVSPQVEASEKAETEETFSTVSSEVRTIATWIPATRQILDDFQSLLSFLRRKLVWTLKKEEEDQVLSGDNTGQNLNGLTNQAAAFDTALTTASDGWEKVDLLRRSLQQVERTDEAAAGFFVIHPDDWADIELMKDTTGRYIAGDPVSGIPPRLWRKPVIVTTGMSTGYFIAGSGTSAEIFDRQEVTVDISTEHSDYFTKNKVAIRCEERVALACYRPAAFIYGQFTTSPA